MNADAATETPPGLFSPRGRMTRMRYIAYSGGLSFLVMLAVGVIAAVLGAVLPGLSVLVMAVGYLAVLVLVVMLTIKRCHDFNATGWLALILIVPIAAVIFWIIPGNEGDNRYGAVPPPNSTPVQVVAWIVIALTALSALSAVLAPGVLIATMQPPA